MRLFALLLMCYGILKLHHTCISAYKAAGSAYKATCRRDITLPWLAFMRTEFFNIRLLFSFIVRIYVVGRLLSFIVLTILVTSIVVEGALPWRVHAHVASRCLKVLNVSSHELGVVQVLRVETCPHSRSVPRSKRIFCCCLLRISTIIVYHKWNVNQGVARLNFIMIGRRRSHGILLLSFEVLVCHAH